MSLKQIQLQRIVSDSFGRWQTISCLKKPLVIEALCARIMFLISYAWSDIHNEYTQNFWFLRSPFKNGITKWKTNSLCVSDTVLLFSIPRVLFCLRTGSTTWSCFCLLFCLLFGPWLMLQRYQFFFFVAIFCHFLINRTNFVQFQHSN